MRVTFYDKVSSSSYKSRGKNTVKFFDRVINYIQQSDRKAPAITASQIDNDDDDSMEEEEEQKEQIDKVTLTPSVHSLPDMAS